MQAKPFILYGSEGCHLCELAEQICFALTSKDDIELVDIVDSDALVELYGTSIPVLERRSDNAKLFWPFDEQTAYQLMNTRSC